jgi:predicted Zn-ribbon and HTH transcriptional regulator
MNEKRSHKISTKYSSELNDIDREAKSIAKIEKELEILETNKCHTCGQDFHDDAHSQVFESKQESLKEANNHRRISRSLCRIRKRKR